MQLQTGSAQEVVTTELSAVPEVEYVYASRQDCAFDVWIVINQASSEVRHRIYAREQAIIESMDCFGFDFHILSRRARDVSSLISGVELIYSRP